MNNIAQTVARMREFYRPRAAESVQLPVQINPVVLQAIDLTRARWHDMPQQNGHVITVKGDIEHMTLMNENRVQAKIAALLGYRGRDELIHRDDLVML